MGKVRMCYESQDFKRLWFTAVELLWHELRSCFIAFHQALSRRPRVDCGSIWVEGKSTSFYPHSYLHGSAVEIQDRAKAK